MYDSEFLDERPEKHLKNMVRKRFGGCCIYCGGRFDILTCDHIVPVCRGGHTSWTNLAPCCSLCNRRKGHKPVFEWWRGERFYNREREEILREWMRG